MRQLSTPVARSSADGSSSILLSMHLAIATPLEAELVDRIREATNVTIWYEPDLLPTPRYPSDHRGQSDFRRSEAQEKRLFDLLSRADAIFGVPGETPDALAAVIRGNPRLRWIQATSAGVGDMMRLAGLTRQEIERVTVTTSSGVHGAQLAEWALFGLLAFTKGLPRLLADQKARRWTQYEVRELRGQTLLIVGLGRIGLAVAERASAMGMRVVGIRRQPDTTTGSSRPKAVDELHGVDELQNLVPSVDAVVMALPRTLDTVGLFGRDLIRQLPPHAIIVNVGRGATIDELALIEALQEHRIAGAALDVYATEPLPPDSPLWELPNVLLSPHTASVTSAENARIVDLLVENIHRWSNCQPLLNVVDIEHYY